MNTKSVKNSVKNSVVMRTKFVVKSKSQDIDGYDVYLEPVVAGSKENTLFFETTPSGSLELRLYSQITAEALKVGQSFYVDFTKADQ